MSTTVKIGYSSNDQKAFGNKSIDKLPIYKRLTFAIKLAEKASSYLQESNVKDLINEAIEVSWKWVHTEENLGEVLYNFLDNEESGFTLFQEMEENEKI